jgi:methyl-accepting chemotaxis protein
MRLKARIIATTTSLAVVISGLLLTAGVVIYERSIADNEANILRTASERLTGEINRANRTSLELATAMAGLPMVKEAILKNDRSLVAPVLVPVFEELKGRYGYERFHLHTPPGMNFFRAHNPSRFGDDDTGVPTIAASFRRSQTTAGLEGGESGSVIAMRGSAPIMHEGKMIGLVQIGLGLTDSTLQTIQLEIGNDLRIQMRDKDGKWGVRAKTAELPQLHAPDALGKVLEGTPAVASLAIDGRIFASYAAPLRDFSGNITGITEAIVDVTPLRKQVREMIAYALIATGAILVLSLLGGWLIGRSLSKPVTAMTATMRRIAEGDLDAEIPASERKDEIGDMADAVLVFKQSAIRNRELDEDQKEMAARQSTMLTQLSETAERVTESIDAIRAAASEISQGSSDLATRTERQASALQETVATMSEVSGNVSANAESSEQARRLAADALTRAEGGNTAVSSVIQAMSGIENSSSKINAIIQVMEEISFQTKLLALNAAVEAARAGESGKGFAVVAQEVRALADRSRQASQQIRDVIAQSAKEVAQGVDLATGAGEALTSIIEIVRQVAEIAPKIASGSREQARSIAEINKALNDLDVATQQNAALVEESSAAAASLADQAGQLVAVASGFRGEAQAAA